MVFEPKEVLSYACLLNCIKIYAGVLLILYFSLQANLYLIFALCMFAQAEKYAGMGLHRTAV